MRPRVGVVGRRIWWVSDNSTGRLENVTLRAAGALWDPDSVVRRVLGVAGLGALVYGITVAVSTAPPGPRLLVLVLTAVAAAVFAVWLVINRSVARLAAALLSILGVTGGLLGGLVPGLGSVFAFVAVFAAGRHLPARLVAVITVVTAAVLTIAGMASVRLSGLGALGQSAGLAAVALGGLNRAVQRRVREQAELLVAEGQVVLEERTRSAALAERTRIAREIHDLLAHSLSGLMVQLEAAHLLLNQHADPAQVAAHVDRARGLARSGLDETKRALQTLRGEPLPTPELLTELIDEHRTGTGAVELVVTGSPRALPADVGLTIYRVTQEALTNVRRHAPGARAEVRLAYQQESVELIVTDHAHASAGGPAPAPSAGSGYGLVGMRERAELLGGELSAGPTADGWRVGLRVPA